jgi:hypothetical protein
VRVRSPPRLIRSDVTGEAVLALDRRIHLACVRPLPSAADQVPNQPCCSPASLAPPSSPLHPPRAIPTPSIPLPRPNPSVALAGRAPSTTNKTALVLLLPGLLCGVAGWPSSPAVRSGGKEADLLVASNVNTDDGLVLPAPLWVRRCVGRWG